MLEGEWAREQKGEEGEKKLNVMKVVVKVWGNMKKLYERIFALNKETTPKRAQWIALCSVVVVVAVDIRK